MSLDGSRFVAIFFFTSFACKTENDTCVEALMNVILFPASGLKRNLLRLYLFVVLQTEGIMSLNGQKFHLVAHFGDFADGFVD